MTKWDVFHAVYAVLRHPSNTYRDAAIKLELAEIVGRRAASGKAKIFNTGDRLWVTSIEVKDKPEF